MPKYHGVMPLRRIQGASAALVLVIPTLLVVTPSGAAVRAPAAPTVATVDDADIAVLEADEAEIRAHLAALQDQRSEARDDLTEARRWADERREQLAEAREAEAEAREVAEWFDLAARLAAAEAYTGAGDGVESLEVLFSENIEESSIKASFLEHRANQRADLLVEQRRAHEDLSDRVAQTEAAAEAAVEAENNAEEALERIDRAVAEQQDLLDALDTRLEMALAEAEALAELDAAAADDIVDDARSLRDEVAEATPPPVAPTPAPTPNPGGATPPSPATTTTTTTPPPVTPPSIPRVSTTTVRGIVVATSIAGNVSSMLAAADAAGLSISGSGYRDPQRQIELRRAHCGPTNYDIYERPASQCSPPTARPGTSMHEKGLALDLTCSGALIRSRSDRCFVWLAANAARYGFYNLPSEPWHWSTNGN